MDASCPSQDASNNGWTTVSVGSSCEKIEYYPEINALLCYHKNGPNSSSLNVLEITTGQILKTFNFSKTLDHLHSLPKQEKVLVGCGDVLGLTREIGGCLYIDSCLQLPVNSTNTEVLMEFPYEEAKVLQEWLCEMDSKDVELRENVKSIVSLAYAKINEALQTIPSEGFNATSEAISSPSLTSYAKRVKWHSVKLNLKLKQYLELIEGLYSFRSKFEKILALKDIEPLNSSSRCSSASSTSESAGGAVSGGATNDHHSIIPILFAIIDRLAPLHPAAQQALIKLEDVISKEVASDCSHNGCVEMGLMGAVPMPGMCSEYARRLTFTTWPHYSYKWAKPDSMAKAGFYHTKGSANTGKDGVQCFKCKINLVKWESSDEPWNEHEQHSPCCLFLKGEPTHNIPIANTIAFSPAVRCPDGKKIQIISNSNHPFLIATSSEDGSVNIWNSCAVPKLYFHFNIDTSDELITNIFTKYSEPQQEQQTSANTLTVFNLAKNKWVPCSPDFFIEEVFYDPTSSLKDLIKNKASNEKMKPKVSVAENPKITFPPEDASNPVSWTDPHNSRANVTSLGLVGFGGMNPSPFGCLVIVGCLIPDPQNSNYKETCLLVYKIDVSDIRALKTVLFESAPDHTNLLMMDDKYSNFASEMSSSLPPHNSTYEFMMGEISDDQAQMDFGVYPSTPSKAEDPVDMTSNIDTYGDFLFTMSSANDGWHFSTPEKGVNNETATLSTNKLSSLLDAKLMQSFPLQFGCSVSHILTEQFGSQPFVYVISSKGTYSSVYVFELDRVFNPFKYAPPNISTTPKNVLKMLYNQQYTRGVIKHALLLPAWSFHGGRENYFFDESTNNIDVVSVLLCVSSVDDIVLYKLPKLECVTLKSNADKSLFSNATIKSISFDCGSDCLCVLTSDGKLHFVELRQLVGEHEERLSSNVVKSTSDSSFASYLATDEQQATESKFSMPEICLKRMKIPLHKNKFDYLFNKKGETPELNTATLEWISQLSECVALTPRYNTTVVPPGWIEIEQEQQQRKLSEHLPRGGSSVMHTRTFRINKESMCRAMIELSLPFNAVLVHVDLKLKLKSNPPSDLSATLYRPAHTELSAKNGPGVGNQGLMALAENEKLLGPVPLNLFAFGQNGLSINVSLTGPNLYLTKHRVILLELSTQDFTSPMNLHEVSITLRKTKKPPTQRTVTQVKTVLYDLSLVSKLLRAVTNPSSVANVGDSREFFMSRPTVQHTALNVLAWLLYTHAVDSSNTKTFLNNFYVTCCSDETMLKRLVRTCLINGDRSLAHLFARFIIFMLRFSSLVMSTESKKFCSRLKNTLLEMLPSSVTCESQGGMHWFQLLFYSVVIGNTRSPLSSMVLNQISSLSQTSSSSSDQSPENAFDICLKLLEYLVSCSESSQDIYTRTLQNKFRLFCNPFEQKIFTFPMHAILTAPNKNNASQNNAPPPMPPNKWYMPPNVPSLADNTVWANKASEFHVISSSRKAPWGSNADQSNSSLDLWSSQSFADLFVPLNFIGFTLDNQLIGFLEAEPLKFTCYEASDGVRMQQWSGVVEGLGGSVHSQTFVDYEDVLNEPGMSPTLVQLSSMAANQAAGSSAPTPMMLFNSMFSSGWSVNPLINQYKSMTDSSSLPLSSYTGMNVTGSGLPFSGKSYADVAKPHSSMSTTVSQNKPSAPISDAIVGSIGGSFTHTPQPQYMLIDNLLAGGRKSVVLDFGRTVMLTDVYIGPCADIASITLDCWIKGEAVDSLRVSTSLEIGNEALALTDIQPALFCRYLKIKVIGRYGMPPNGQPKVILPINTFYGHSLDYEYEMIPRDSRIRAITDLQEKHLKTLAIVHDDLLCRYSLASNHLKSLLKSHSTSLADINSAEEKRFVSEVCSNCRILQRQLNVVTRVINRVKTHFATTIDLSSTSLSGSVIEPQIGSDEISQDTPLSCATSTHISHSTRFLLFSMLELATQQKDATLGLSSVDMNAECPISQQQCLHLFTQLCIKGLPHNGVVALTLLHQVCHRQSWWPKFVSSSFLQFFTDSTTNSDLLLHVVKVFITLLHLAKQSNLMDNIMLSFVTLLLNGLPNTENSQSPIVPPVNLDFLNNSVDSAVGNSAFPVSNCNWSQLSAILMLMSQAMTEKQADMTWSHDKSDKMSDRWDFFPNVLKSDFLSQKMASLNQMDKYGKNSKKDKRGKAFYGYGISKKHETLLDPCKHATDEGPSHSGGGVYKNEKEKKSKNGGAPPPPPKGVFNTVQSDVKLPCGATKELISRLLCVLPELIRSQSVDLVILLCRVVSLLTNACDKDSDSSCSIRMAQLFPANLLSHILMNAFVLTTNQLITYAVQTLLVDIMQVELNAVLSPIDEPDAITVNYGGENSASTSAMGSNNQAQCSHSHSNLSSNNSCSDNKHSSTKEKTKTGLSMIDDYVMSFAPVDLFRLPSESATETASSLSNTLDLESVIAEELLQQQGSSKSNDHVMDNIMNLYKMENMHSSVVFDTFFGGAKKQSAEMARIKSLFDLSNSEQKAAAHGCEKNGDCLDLRLESGILHHSERWLNQLQSSYTSGVYNNLACLNFYPPRQPQKNDQLPSVNEQRSQNKLESPIFVQSNPIPNNSTFNDTKRLLQNVFDELLLPRNLPYLDLKEVLLFWFHVTNCKSSREVRKHRSAVNSNKITIGLTSDNMAHIFNKLTIENTSDSAVWSLLFQCLITVCQSSQNTCEASSVGGVSKIPSEVRRDLKSNMEPTTIIISNLIHYPVLDTFLSGSWGMGGTRSEQCRGPAVTQIFGTFLEVLIKSSKDSHLLGQLFMKLLKSMCDFSGAIKQGYGPIDCQVELVNAMIDSPCQTHDPKLICSLVNVICKLGYDYISNYRDSVSLTAYASNIKPLRIPPNVCLTGASNCKPTKFTMNSYVNCRETLLKQLFKLAQKLVQNKISFSQISNMPGENTVADCIVCDEQLPVINTLLVTLSGCVLPVGVAETFTGDYWNVKQIETFVSELFSEDQHMAIDGMDKGNKAVDGKTLGDYILQLLFCLESHTRERKVLYQRLVQSLNSAGTFPPTLSQVILCFFLHLLKNFDQVQMFASVGGLQVLINKIVNNCETGPGFGFSLQPLNVLQKLTHCFELDNLELRHNDVPKNIGPKATISCSSDPTAQLPDVLLQENPPHKRARSAAWTYHFPADSNEQSCSLTITLPTLSIVHYVEIKLQMPTMGMSQNLPSLISLEMFPSRRDSLSVPPCIVTAPFIVFRASVGSSSSIQLRPHEPQLCGTLTLSFYPPPEGTSIGLSHIAVYARPVLSNVAQPVTSTVHLSSSLHALKLIEYCMEKERQNISKRQSSFSTTTAMAQQDLHLLGSSLFSDNLTASTRDRLLSACLSLLSQSSAQPFFPCLKRIVLCLATTAITATSSSPNEYELQSARDQLQLEREVQNVQAHTIQHVVVVLLNSFINSNETLTGIYVDEVLDLLFSLCTHDGSQQILLNRISVLVSWLEANLLSICENSKQSTTCVAHLVHAISSVLWRIHYLYISSLINSSGPLTGPMQSGNSSSANIGGSGAVGCGGVNTPLIVSVQTFSNICSHVLHSGVLADNNVSTSPVLKNAFDWLLCSFVHMYPSFLKTLLRLLGCPDLQTCDQSSTAAATAGGPMSPSSPIPSFPNDATSKSYLCKQWWASLSPSQLATLHHCLLDARSLDVFRNFAPVADMFSLLIDLSLTDQEASTISSATTESNVKTLIRLLDFLSSISENNPQAKRWLGQAEKTRFWSPLLTSLCYDTSRQQCLNLTEAALKFFETVVDDNTSNQRNLAEIVSQLISQKKDALNSFVKQLILNVFLKEERVLVVVNSTQDNILKWPSSAGLPTLGHPKYGIGHRVVYGKIDADASMEVLINDILESSHANSDHTKPPTLANSAPVIQKVSKLGQKKKTLEKLLASDKYSPVLLKQLVKNSTNSTVLSTTTKMKVVQSSSDDLSDLNNVSFGIILPNDGLPIVDLESKQRWRLVHKILGSDWLPNSSTFRHVSSCLKQIQSPDVEEGFIRLDLAAIECEQYEEMEVAIASSLNSMMDSSFGGSSQSMTNLRPPQVFASVGGFTKLALRIPVLNPDFVKVMCTNGKDSTTSGGASVAKSSSFMEGGNVGGVPGSDKLDFSDWILIDQHTLIGGSGMQGSMGPKSSYSNVIDLETSDEENYPFDWTDDMGPGTAGPGSLGAAGASGASCAGGFAVVAPHCLALLGLTLQLPLYVEVLLREERKARFLLRILLGVSDIGDSTTSILSTPEAKNLSTLPLEALRSLFDEYPVNTELGLVIRQQCVDAQILHLLFGCLAVLTHRNPESADVKSYQFLFPSALFGGSMSNNSGSGNVAKQSEKSHPLQPQGAAPHGIGGGGGPGGSGSGSGKQVPQYWAKGTGFGTGSMQSGWNMEQCFLRKGFEEQNSCAILQVLASFIAGTGKSTNSDGSEKTVVDLYSASTSSMGSYIAREQINIGPSSHSASAAQNKSSKSGSAAVDLSNFSCRLHDLISQSCLLEVLNSYLNNDSVLDISRHVAVYQAVLDVIKSMVTQQETANQLVHLLEDSKVDANLRSIRSIVNNYTNQLSKNLKFVSANEKSSNAGLADAEETEGINRLSTQLDAVSDMVELARKSYHANQIASSESRSIIATCSSSVVADDAMEEDGEEAVAKITKLTAKTPAELYCEIVKPLQFLSFKMVKEGSGKNLATLNVPYHFLTEAKMASDTLNTKRAKRLAQESVTLSSALPLDFSSSVFIRYDEDRLDVMKVLITGPSDTPYANGCFIFDIFFPADYPNSPLLCNFTTTGGGTIRFNPNLYNDGKVCLSILNTWHGRPEEKWNAQTSNLLQVLVSIQSLILVSEPYFNEPGYERSRNTAAGQQSSDEYSANIQQATVKWAMLNQLKKPCPCFKDIIQTHFYLKRAEITAQVQDWLNVMEVMDKNKRYGKKLSNHVASLKKSSAALIEEFHKLKAPPGLDESTLDNVFGLTTTAAAGKFSISAVAASSTMASSNEPSSTNNAAAATTSSSQYAPETQTSSQQLNKNKIDSNLIIGTTNKTDTDLKQLQGQMGVDDAPQSPTSKAASDLLNSVLDVVFWAPSQSAASDNTNNTPVDYSIAPHPLSTADSTSSTSHTSHPVVPVSQPQSIDTASFSNLQVNESNNEETPMEEEHALSD